MTEPAVKKYSSSRVVSELSRTAAKRNEIDLLLVEEGVCLADLVSKVHRDGYVGSDWPTVKRHPMRWVDDGKGGRMLEHCEKADQDEAPEPEDWYIRAHVLAAPR